MELSEDIGEWVADGVVLCRLVKKLQPQLMPSFHAPSQGKVSHSIESVSHINAPSPPPPPPLTEGLVQRKENCKHC